MTTEGEITEFSLPATDRGPGAITAGSDGALWFTESVANQIGRITVGGSITEFALPTGVPASGPSGLTVGPDGNLWYAHGGKIGRMTTSGSVSEFPMPPGPVGSSAADVVTGPDGNLWFTDPLGNRIGRVTTNGTFTMFTLPTPEVIPLAITSGPDGAMWFTQIGGSNIGRVTTDGAFSCLSLTPTALCLNGGRFRVQAHWRSKAAEGDAGAVPLSDESGYFWFFESGNIEIVVKVLNACKDPFNSYWVFAAGLTNLEATLTVTDVKDGTSREYANQLGTPFLPILDTAAFRSCP